MLEPFWIRRTRRVLGVLNYMGTIENQTEPNALSQNPSPAGPEITTRADPVRLINGFLAVRSAPFFRIDLGCLFACIFLNIEDLLFCKKFAIIIAEGNTK